MLRLSLLTASNRQPDWVDDGAADYAKRLRGRCTLEIKTLPLARRTASTPIERAIADEGERMLAAIPAGAHVVALDERGKPWSTKDLAAKLDGWMRVGAPVFLLIGGPDGLSPACIGARRRPLVALQPHAAARPRARSSPPKPSTAPGRCSSITPTTAPKPAAVRASPRFRGLPPPVPAG